MRRAKETCAAEKMDSKSKVIAKTLNDVKWNQRKILLKRADEAGVKHAQTK